MAKIKDKFRKVRALVFYNTRCIKCHTCQEDMITIGLIPFCDDCYFEEFGNIIKIDIDNENYVEWLGKYKNLET